MALIQAIFSYGIIGIIGLAVLCGIVLIIMNFRTVVPTNMVHITQSKKGTIPYGKGLGKTVYYFWPSWIPVIGMTRVTFPTSIFKISINEYRAYDKDKVPFLVDVIAFFQTEDPTIAAQRLESFDELQKQLEDILNGVIRKVLGSAEIEEIMVSRGELSASFTEEVTEQLSAWGVKTVKAIEFMDIRDDHDSSAISNIQARKQSEIEKTMRLEVAKNSKLGEVAEIEARRETELSEQEAKRVVGEKEAERKRMVGIADEKAKQDIQEEARSTAKKEMAVKKVEEETRADIDRQVAETKAEQDKAVEIKSAEAEYFKQEQIAKAQQILGESEAAADLAKGKAEAEAKTLIEMAPVSAKIALAKEIGTNEGYQKYLLGVEGLKVGETVGVAKATAMENSDLKIIANAGSPEQGLTSIGELFTSSGGTKMASMLEAMANTPVGKELLAKIVPAIKEDNDFVKSAEYVEANDVETDTDRQDVLLEEDIIDNDLDEDTNIRR